jgi:uncharacterized Zn-binding protein involved in type VI secretion
MPPAARITDLHSCSMIAPNNVPHLGNEIDGPGDPTVIIGYQPAARDTDIAKCQGPVAPGAKGLDLDDPIVGGSGSVYIGEKKAARVGDHTAHGGTIISGHPTVRIGDTSQGAALISAGAPLVQPCDKPE